MTRKTPKKGDIVYMDFDPQSGHEQSGHRPALVITTKDFNSKTGFAFVCPITSQVKGYPFEVLVEGAKKAKGVILADQLKSLDWNARQLKPFDSVSDECMQKVIALIDIVIKAPENNF